MERELVLRLASLLWRIRRATTMETGLFDIQARQLLEFRRKRDAQQSLIRGFFPPADPNEGGKSDSEHIAPRAISGPNPDHCSTDLARCYLRLANLPSYPLDRLSRYEAALWRQAGQILFALAALDRCKPWERRTRFRVSRRPDQGAHGHDGN